MRYYNTPLSFPPGPRTTRSRSQSCLRLIRHPEKIADRGHRWGWKLIDKRSLGDVTDRLGEAVLDPLRWSDLMEDICSAVGAKGAAMLQGDVRTEDIPCTAGVAEFFEKAYFGNMLHVSDVRAIRGVPLLMTKTNVVTDANLFRSEAEMLRDPLYAALCNWGLKWFAAVGFRAGSALWGLAIQRTPQEGMFNRSEIAALSRLSDRLTETATLSTAVGRIAIASVTNALDLIEQPAIALDRRGFVLGANCEAEAYLRGDLMALKGQFALADKNANCELRQMIEQIGAVSDLEATLLPSVVVRRPARSPLILQPLPVPPAARSPFLGARVILLIKDLDRDNPLRADWMVKAFGLTPAQTALAIKIAGGSSLEQAAVELGVALETARNHLKAVFSKTDTHRQGELVALLNRLRG